MLIAASLNVVYSVFTKIGLHHYNVGVFTSQFVRHSLSALFMYTMGKYWGVSVFKIHTKT